MDIYESFQIENHVLGRVVKGFVFLFFGVYFFPTGMHISRTKLYRFSASFIVQ